MIMSYTFESLNQRGLLENALAAFLALAVTAGTFGVFLFGSLS
jgi:hypothetical protein